MQPLLLAIDPITPHYSDKLLLQLCIFGLVAPSILGVLNRALGSAINKPVATKPAGHSPASTRQASSIFIAAAWGVAFGLSGFAWYKVGVIPKAALIVAGFFGSAGLGFLMAYLLGLGVTSSEDADA
ncbi:hypothetical protein [Luteitalea sp. TBR-22]|uniref:hypothetical protein n=1 Tax=Luteitalea sp. TBR-22 TaxID=2802971 RepID=UPI001EF44089|nr:hypothetical protein [Luteitalea sp. TBR-22]